LSEAEGGQFPETIETNDITLPLRYRFDPGHVADGVTATVHLADLHAIDADRLDWLVPGLIEEKVTDLVRTLPKKLRTQFVPVPEVAHRAVLRMPFGEGSLTSSLARFLADERRIEVSADDFDPTKLDDYLRINLRIVDEHDKPVAHGRDIVELRKRLKIQARRKFEEKPDPKWHRDHLVTWNGLPDLPERVEVKRNGRGVQGFPALADRGDSASLRLFESAQAARAAHRAGVRRLLLLDYAAELKHQVTDLPTLNELRLLFSPIGNAGSMKAHLIEAAGDRLFLGEDPSTIRTKAAFEERVNAAWGKLGGSVKDVADTAMAILRLRQRVALALDKPVPDILTSSVAEMKEQLALLVPADFLVATPAVWIGHVPRYLAAIEQRHAKLLNAGLDRDSKLATKVFPYWKAYLDRIADAESGPCGPAWVTFRFLVEEYRVSLFAQQLGTATKVSEKILAERMERLRKAAA
ncbi:MAG: DUF3418 domain-containing protein, partial [Planctomycetota bacterium]